MLLSFTHRLKRFFIISVLAAAAASLMSFLTPLIVGFTVDAVIGDVPASLPGPVMAIFERMSGRGAGGSGSVISRRGAGGSDLVICAFMVAA